jgi:hypothetical protein
MAELYNKAALERLSSPEQLDKAISVSKPISWLALLGVTVIIAAAVVWSIFGTLPTVTPVNGIILRSDAMVSDESGDISDDELSEAPQGQIAECYVPYSLAKQLSVGMRAMVYSTLNDARYEAEIIDIFFDGEMFSDMELVLNSDSIPVVVSLRLVGSELPERALVTVSIITEEIAPFEMAFRGIRERIRR